jgi:hypothetical protein
VQHQFTFNYRVFSLCMLVGLNQNFDTGIIRSITDSMMTNYDDQEIIQITKQLIQILYRNRNLTCTQKIIRPVLGHMYDQ